MLHTGGQHIRCVGTAEIIMWGLQFLSPDLRNENSYGKELGCGYFTFY